MWTGSKDRANEMHSRNTVKKKKIFLFLFFTTK